jgi:putative polyketide hydroxylase
MANIMEVPVLIVGGSIVGLAQALFLARHGVRALTVERHAATSPHPRARAFHQRSIELFRASGVAARLEALGAPTEAALAPSIVATSLLGPFQSSTVRPPEAHIDPWSPAKFVYLGQDRFEPVLRDAAQAAGADIRAEHELISWRETAAGIEAVVRARGEALLVRAQYLVAADGVRSSIREQLGVRQSGRGSMGHNTAFLFTAELSGVPPFGMAIITHPQARGVLVPTDVPGRYIYSIDDPAPDDIRARLRLATGLPTLEPAILGRFPWEIAERVAERMHVGRVFLVGDAAHQLPPMGGFGANAGIQDAANLAWKLAFVLRGAASAALLDSYHCERHPVCVATARHAAVSALRMSPAGREATRDEALPDADCVMRAYRYGAEPVIPQHLTDASRRAAVGGRAPHVWLDHAAGSSSLDLFDKRLVLISADAAWRAAACKLDVDFEHTPRCSDAYAIGQHGAALVRPDAIIAAHWPELPREPAAALKHAVGQLLRLD